MLLQPREARHIREKVRYVLDTQELRSIQVKLIKIGAKVIHHARQIVFQMAEVVIPKQLFAQILAHIRALAPTGG